MTDRRFPDGFVWGVATAGHQNEGDNTTSDTWFLELLQSTIFSEPSGRACNTWENEPNLPEMLRWAGFTAFVRDLERATLQAASSTAGVERYRAANVMLPEDFAGMRAGMTAGHLAARTMIKSHRADPPVGLSIAITDDVAHGDGLALRDRKREEVYATGALLDNFEWIFGYAKHFGLHTVDRETFVRTPKPSAAAYGRIARAGAVPGD